MKTGPLWQISIETSAAAEEAVMLMLERLHGAPASSCTDAETGAVVASAFLKTKAGSPRPSRARLAAGLEHLRSCGLDPAPGRIAIRLLRPENWAESWKRHFKPLVIGPQLVIQPSFSKRRPRPGQSVVVLDPGLSFGTGQHPTTAFCLKQVAERRQAGPGQSFLDIGCGSGILAIAAAKLGYRPVDGFDFDPDAVRVAKANAVQNGVRPFLFLGDVSRLPLRRPAQAKNLPGKPRPPLPRLPQYQLVCANLIYDLLLAETRRISHCVAPGGWLVLAGILDRQFEEVRLAYEQSGFHCEESAQSGPWKSGRFSLGD